MDIEMKYIYAVYQERSFSKAAERLFISQSAVSAMVKKAEAALGTQLFDRSTIPLRVTEEGRFYMEQIEKIQRIEADIGAYFADRKNLKYGKICIGSSSFYSAHVLTALLRDFRKRYPGIAVEIREGDGQELRQFLREGTIDFLFGTLLRNQIGPAYQNLFYEYEQLILVVPERFSVNERLLRYQIPIESIMDNSFLQEQHPPVPLQQFKEVPFLSLTKEGSDLYRRTIDICGNAGFTPQVVQQFSQIMTAYYAAAAGEGATFVRSSVFSVLRELPGLRYYKLGDPLARREILLTYRKDRYVTHAMEAFLSYFSLCSTGRNRK